MNEERGLLHETCESAAAYEAPGIVDDVPLEATSIACPSGGGGKASGGIDCTAATT